MTVKKKDDSEKELIPINIGNINEGAMVAGFEIELEKALANIADLNTPATSTRVVILQLLLKPHSDRVVIDTEFKISLKLAAIETHKSRVFLGRTSEGGLVAFDNDPRQMSLWSAPAPVEVQKPIEFNKGK